MTAGEARIKDTLEWLEFAQRDLMAAKVDLGSSFPLNEDIQFHAQQAAEKSLKALLYWHSVPFRKTHDMQELVDQCLAVSPELESTISAVSDFTPFAALGRYPHEETPEPPSRVEAEAALVRAHAVFDVVCALLPAEAVPPPVE